MQELRELILSNFINTRPTDSVSSSGYLGKRSALESHDFDIRAGVLSAEMASSYSLGISDKSYRPVDDYGSTSGREGSYDTLIFFSSPKRSWDRFLEDFCDRNDIPYERGNALSAVVSALREDFVTNGNSLFEVGVSRKKDGYVLNPYKRPYRKSIKDPLPDLTPDATPSYLMPKAWRTDEPEEEPEPRYSADQILKMLAEGMVKDQDCTFSCTCPAFHWQHYKYSLANDTSAVKQNPRSYDPYVRTSELPDKGIWRERHRIFSPVGCKHVTELANVVSRGDFLERAIKDSIRGTR